MIFSTKLSVNYENIQKNKRAIIVDNFYKDPDAVREYALQQEFFEGNMQVLSSNGLEEDRPFG